ncbi:Methionine synthase reductase [Holothuria leucospilota]|uniref:Methionine synthase reductase n=1 Tax=Holothuria leucospilota TaxID=206669 RepID=A0A9Q1BZR9_HOLLE|nr:Methionine synthase reductase [Holothuria leucospilota]
MPHSVRNRFLLLYGSETGQAQAIAEEIYQAAPQYDLAPELHCLSLTDKKFNIEKERCLVMVVSTTGEGDPPETAEKFWRRLKKKTLPSNHLAHLRYTLLALGDSNYTNFCQNGKNFDNRLEELGAKRFYATAYADDAVGLEVVVEPWIAGLWPELKKELGLDSCSSSLNCQEAAKDNCISDSRDGPETVDVQTSPQEPDQGSKDQNSDLKTQNSETSVPNATEIDSVSVVSTSNVKSNSFPQEKVVSEKHTDGTGSDQKIPNLEKPGVASLVYSLPPLCNSSLTLPLNPPSYLEVTFEENTNMDVSEFLLQNNATFPSAASPVTMAAVTKATRLTSHDAVKTTLELELQLSDTTVDFQPGDSVGVICPNNYEEVSSLITRLDLDKVADTPFTLKLETGTRKRRATIPEFVPKFCTVRHAFTKCFDIRTPPKKAFLRMLSESTGNQQEQRRLQELCSKEGAADYNQYIRKQHLSLFDILQAFPSCLPPLDRVLENLTRLLPRPYSIASSPLASVDRFRFAFNVLQFPATKRKRSQQGVCSGWLDQITSGFQETKNNSEVESEKFKKMKLEEKPKIPIYFRQNTKFRLSKDILKPIIMIGPGTGVAPFIGFMEHRLHMKHRSTESVTFGNMWLFYGCRHRDRDYLYRDKINGFLDEGILTKLSVSFSRDDNPSDKDQPRYVQDNMKIHKEELADLVMNKEAIVYVCGDANGMAKNVMEAWVEILCEYTKKTAFEVSVLLATMREEERYLQDVWT